MSTPLRERPDAPLGTLIFRAGLLPAETIESALEEGVKTGKRLGEILTERGLISEVDLARLLAGQKGLEFVILREQIVDPAAASLFTAEQARLFRALPYAFDGELPVVAIADPTDEVLIRNIREALGHTDARFVVTARGELAEIAADVYSRPLGPPPDAAPVAPETEPATHEAPMNGSAPEGPAPEADHADPIPDYEPEPVLPPLPEAPAPEAEPVAAAEPVGPEPSPIEAAAPAFPDPEPETGPLDAATPEAEAPALQVPVPDETVQPAPALPEATPSAEPAFPAPAGPESYHATEPGSYDAAEPDAPTEPHAPEPYAPDLSTPAEPPTATPGPPIAPPELVVDAPAEPAAAPLPEPPTAPEPIRLAEPAVPEHAPPPAETPAPVDPTPAPEPVPLHFPGSQPPPAPYPPAAEAIEPEPAPPPEETPVAPGPAQPVSAPWCVTIRLANGERVDAGEFPDQESAKLEARTIMGQVGSDQDDWPFVNGRFLKPDTIVSVDIAESAGDDT